MGTKKGLVGLVFRGDLMLSTHDRASYQKKFEMFSPTHNLSSTMYANPTYIVTIFVLISS